MLIKENIKLQIPKKSENKEAAELFNTFHNFCTGENNYTPESVLSNWERPRFSLTNDARVIKDNKGKWIAYAAVLNMESPYAENIISFRINPDYTGCGIGSALTSWAEQKAKENIKKAPEDSKVIMLSSNYIKMDSASGFLTNRGFSASRYYFRMSMDLPEAEKKVVFPAGLTVETFEKRKNLKELIDCTEDCFLDHWGWWRMPDDELLADWNHHIKTNIYHDPDLWSLVMDGDKLVGFCLTDTGMNNNPDTAYIDMIGVRKEYRKKGIASALLESTISRLIQKGKKAVSLHVDGSSLTGATRVYERAGLKVDQTRIMFEKTIRPGNEYRSQNS